MGDEDFTLPEDYEIPVKVLLDDDEDDYDEDCIGELNFED